MLNNDMDQHGATRVFLGIHSRIEYRLLRQHFSSNNNIATFIPGNYVRLQVYLVLRTSALRRWRSDHMAFILTKITSVILILSAPSSNLI